MARLAEIYHKHRREILILALAVGFPAFLCAFAGCDSAAPNKQVATPERTATPKSQEGTPTPTRLSEQSIRAIQATITPAQELEHFLEIMQSFDNRVGVPTETFKDAGQLLLEGIQTKEDLLQVFGLWQEKTNANFESAPIEGQQRQGEDVVILPQQYAFFDTLQQLGLNQVTIKRNSPEIEGGVVVPETRWTHMEKGLTQTYKKMVKDAQELRHLSEEVATKFVLQELFPQNMKLTLDAMGNVVEANAIVSVNMPDFDRKTVVDSEEKSPCAVFTDQLPGGTATLFEGTPVFSVEDTFFTFSGVSVVPLNKEGKEPQYPEGVPEIAKKVREQGFVLMTSYFKDQDGRTYVYWTAMFDLTAGIKKDVNDPNHMFFDEIMAKIFKMVLQEQFPDAVSGPGFMMLPCGGGKFVLIPTATPTQGATITPTPDISTGTPGRPSETPGITPTPGSPSETPDNPGTLTSTPKPPTRTPGSPSKTPGTTPTHVNPTSTPKPTNTKNPTQTSAPPTRTLEPTQVPQPTGTPGGGEITHTPPPESTNTPVPQSTQTLSPTEIPATPVDEDPTPTPSF